MVNRVVPEDEVETVSHDYAKRLSEFDEKFGITADYLETIYHTRRELGATSSLWANWQHGTFDYRDRRSS